MEGDLLTSGTISTVWRRTLGGFRVYAKRYRYSSPRWRYLFYKNRGRMEVWSYSRLRELGIPCPEVLAFCEKTRYGRFHWCLIVTKEIPNSRNLFDLLSTDQEDTSLRTRIMERLGHLVGIMHRQNFFHRDLKLRNIIWEDTDGSDVRLFFMDCPRGHKGWHFSRSALYDLWTLHKHCRLVCTDKEWRTFLETYVTHSDFSIETLQRAIDKEGEKRA